MRFIYETHLAVKVKVKVGGTFHSLTVHEGPGGVDYSCTFSLTSEEDGGWVVNAKPRPLYPGNETVLTAQGTGWTPGPVWTVAENIAPPPDMNPGQSRP